MAFDPGQNVAQFQDTMRRNREMHDFLDSRRRRRRQGGGRGSGRLGTLVKALAVAGIVGWIADDPQQAGDYVEQAPGYVDQARGYLDQARQWIESRS